MRNIKYFVVLDTEVVEVSNYVLQELVKELFAAGIALDIKYYSRGYRLYRRDNHRVVAYSMRWI